MRLRNFNPLPWVLISTGSVLAAFATTRIAFPARAAQKQVVTLIDSEALNAYWLRCAVINLSDDARAGITRLINTEQQYSEAAFSSGWFDEQRAHGLTDEEIQPFFLGWSFGDSFAAAKLRAMETGNVRGVPEQLPYAALPSVAPDYCILLGSSLDGTRLAFKVLKSESPEAYSACYEICKTRCAALTRAQETREARRRHR